MTPKRFSPLVYVVKRMCFDGSPYGSTTRLVALMIASYMSEKSDGRFRSNPGYRAIGYRAGIHKDTVKRTISELTRGDNPIFELTPGKRGAGRRLVDMCNTYAIPARHVDVYARKRTERREPPVRVHRVHLPSHEDDASPF